MPRRSALAFTLVELLVVVAIIALLISILLPSLNGARKQARQALCLTNLRSQLQAAQLYLADNREWGVRGIAGFGTQEYHIFATSILRYVAPAIESNPDKLWLAQNTPGMLAMYRIFESTKVYQCPDHPDPTHTLDYVASAFPIRYGRASVDLDVSGGGEAGDRFQGVYGASDETYHATYKLTEFEGVAPTASIVMLAEGHVSLPLYRPPTYMLNGLPEFRFNHVFLTSQLSFGAFPRIASDQRHPKGTTAGFFDGSARALELKAIDPGYPNSLGLRLKYFAVPPADFQ